MNKTVRPFVWAGVLRFHGGLLGFFQGIYRLKAKPRSSPCWWSHASRSVRVLPHRALLAVFSCFWRRLCSILLPTNQELGRVWNDLKEHPHCLAHLGGVALGCTINRLTGIRGKTVCLHTETKKRNNFSYVECSCLHQCRWSVDAEASAKEPLLQKRISMCEPLQACARTDQVARTLLNVQYMWRSSNKLMQIDNTI